MAISRGALVLGGGGVTGIAWETGLLAGLAEAGVDLAVMQALLGRTHIDTTARYIHLAPVHVKAEFDAARDRQRSRS